MKVTITIDDDYKPADAGFRCIKVDSNPKQHVLEQSREGPDELSHWAHLIALTALDAIKASMARIGVQGEVENPTESWPDAADEPAATTSGTTTSTAIPPESCSPADPLARKDPCVP